MQPQTLQLAETTQQPLWPTNQSRPKPAGGFSFLTIPQICMAWTLYRERHLTAYQLRVYFACLEALERRRSHKKPNRTPDYTPEEIHRLVGGRGVGAARRALRRLHNLKLISWSPSTLRLAQSPDELRIDDLTAYWEMLEK